MDDKLFLVFAGIAQDGSNEALKPTPQPLDRNGLTILGRVTANDPDYFHVPIPEGMRLSSLTLTNFNSEDPIAFVALQQGSVFTADQDLSKMVVGQHVGATVIGKNLLPASSVPVTGGLVLWVNQTGTSSEYAFSVRFEYLLPLDVKGSENSEVLRGNEGSDQIIGYGGNDTIDGALGVDTAIYQSLSRDYSLALFSDRRVLVYGVEREPSSTVFFIPTDGTDTLINIERLQFADKTIRIDTKSHDSYADLPDTLYQFFVVGFGAAPGVTYMDQMAEAYRYWLPQYKDGTVKQIVEAFTTKSQFTSVYPQALYRTEGGKYYAYAHDASLAGNPLVRGAEVSKAVFDTQMASLAQGLVATIVKTSASEATKTAAAADIQAALGLGGDWTIGKVIYTVFGNLASKPLSDPTWGGTAKQFANQVAVAKYYTDTLSQSTDDVTTLRSVMAAVTNTTDVSSTDAIASLIGVALLNGPGG